VRNFSDSLPQKGLGSIAINTANSLAILIAHFRVSYLFWIIQFGPADRASFGAPNRSRIIPLSGG